jgi:hypothetical protein
VTDDPVIRWGLVVAAAFLVLVALVFVGEAFRPTRIMLRCGGAATILPNGSVGCGPLPMPTRPATPRDPGGSSWIEHRRAA